MVGPRKACYQPNLPILAESKKVALDAFKKKRQETGTATNID